MELAPDVFALALPATALLLLAWLALRVRQRQQHRRSSPEAVDTLAGWPPEPTRVLSITERQAHDLLRRAMPGFLVMAQVPLSRFIRVPTRHSYADWLRRVGSLSADLLVCDAGSRVLAAIDVREVTESERSRRRHERLARVLRAAHIPVYEWREGQLPSVIEARGALASLLGHATAVKPGKVAAPAKALQLTPLPDIAELLSEGDRAAFEAELDASHEPVPSAFMDDLELAEAVR